MELSLQDDKELVNEVIMACNALDLDCLRRMLDRLPDVDCWLPHPTYSWQRTSVMMLLLEKLNESHREYTKEEVEDLVCEAVQVILDAGADPSRTHESMYADSPLMKCIQSPKVAQLLLAGGARVIPLENQSPYHNSGVLERMVDKGRSSRQGLSPQVLDMVVEATEQQLGSIPRDLLFSAARLQCGAAQKRLDAIDSGLPKGQDPEVIQTFRIQPSVTEDEDKPHLSFVLVKGRLSSWKCDAFACDCPKTLDELRPGSAAEELFGLAPQLADGFKKKCSWQTQLQQPAQGDLPVMMIFWGELHDSTKRHTEDEEGPAQGSLHGAEGSEANLHRMILGALNGAGEKQCSRIAMPPLGKHLSHCNAARTCLNTLVMFVRRAQQEWRGSSLIEVAMVSEHDADIEEYRMAFRRLHASEERRKFFFAEHSSALTDTCPQPFMQPTFNRLANFSLEQPTTQEKAQRGSNLDLGGVANGFSADGFLSLQECRDLIEASEACGLDGVDWEYQPAYRACQRVVFLAEHVSKELWQRLMPLISRDDIHEVCPMGWASEGIWSPVGVNECLRVSRYDVDGHFAMHRDGPFVINNDLRSVFTVLIYLNEDFEGGATAFETGDNLPVVMDLVQPKTGSALIFTHNARHQGCPVTRGCKYVLRTDVMFRRMDTMSLTQQVMDLKDPRYQQCEAFYRESIELQNQGDRKGSTEKYLAALEMQADLAAIRRRRENKNGLLSDSIWVEIFLCLTDPETVLCASMSRRAQRLALDSCAWLRRYSRRWHLPQTGLNPHVAWYSLYKFRRAADENWRVACFDMGFRMTRFVLLGLRSAAQPSGHSSFWRLNPSCSEVGVIPSAITKVRGHYWGADSGFQNYYVGRDAIGRGDQEVIRGTFKSHPDRQPDFGVFTEIVRWVFRFGLETGCNPSEHPLAIVLPPHLPSRMREEFAATLRSSYTSRDPSDRHSLMVPYLLLENHAFLALLSAGRSTGLSIHLAEVCSVTAVSCGCCSEPATFLMPPGLHLDTDHFNQKWANNRYKHRPAQEKADVAKRQMSEEARASLISLTTQAAKDVLEEMPGAISGGGLVLTCDTKWSSEALNEIRKAVAKIFPGLKSFDIDSCRAVVQSAALVAASPEGRSRFQSAEGSHPPASVPQLYRW